MKIRDWLVLIAVAVTAIAVLFATRDVMRFQECDASGTQPGCEISGPVQP